MISSGCAGVIAVGGRRPKTEAAHSQSGFTPGGRIIADVPLEQTRGTARVVDPGHCPLRAHMKCPFCGRWRKRSRGWQAAEKMAARRAAAAGDSLKSTFHLLNQNSRHGHTDGSLLPFAEKRCTTKKGWPALMSVNKLSPLPLSRDFDNVPMRH